MIPTGKNRKEYPVGTGVLGYFPDALLEVAHVSYIGNKQHHGEGSPLHWDRSLSTDEPDALIRHFLERGTFDEDGCRHSAKLVWRSLALLQNEIEAERIVSVSNTSTPPILRCVHGVRLRYYCCFCGPVSYSNVVETISDTKDLNEPVKST